MKEPNKTNDSTLHPIGTGVGAAAGALAGQTTAAAVNSRDEHAYWRENYAKQPYAELSRSYSDYAPAYQYGWESRGRMKGRSFEQAEGELGSGWNKAKGASMLGWENAKAAVRDAWNRIDGR